MLAPVRNAAKAGSFVVSAAGNGGDGCSSSPGNIHDVLSVGAVDGDGDVPSFSGGERINVSKAWGEDAPSDWPTEYVVPNVTALGVGVYSTVPGGGYGRMDGTSTAVPHVAGVAALVESATRRDMTPGELRDVIASGARKSDDGLDTRHGVGTVDAYAAVAEAREEVDIQESLSEGVSVPDTTDGNGTEGGDSGEEPEEDGVPPTPGFGVVAFLAAVLLRKVTCHSGDTG
jgi:subtilisin family serine protease